MKRITVFHKFAAKTNVKNKFDTTALINKISYMSNKKLRGTERIHIKTKKENTTQQSLSNVSEQVNFFLSQIFVTTKIQSKYIKIEHYFACESGIKC